MGPVSFESLDAGADRAEAMTLAASLRAAGIRVIAVNDESGAAGARFTVVIRSADLGRARRTMATLDQGPTPRPGTS
ncbi:MAG: hypothetical protein AAFN30_05840 [Actinomycetota bacterium]